MSGWNTIQRIRNLEEKIDLLGFKFSKSKHGDWTDSHGALSLVPKDADALPMYSRDAELFVGSIERLADWLAGVQWPVTTTVCVRSVVIRLVRPLNKKNATGT